MQLPQLSDAWASALIGLVGTLVGAGISWFASIRIYRQQVKDEQLTSALSLLVQIQIAYSDIIAVKAHIDASITDAEKQGKNNFNHSWARVIPLAGTPVPWQLDSRELGFLARARQYSLMQDVITFAMKHSSLMTSMVQYNLIRLELNRELEPAEKDGVIFGAQMDKQQYMRLLPRMIEADSLIESIIAALAEDAEYGMRLLDRIGPAGKRIFGQRAFPSLSIRTSAAELKQ